MIERVLTGLSAGVLTAGILCPSHKDGGDFDLKARTGVQTSEPTTMFDHGKGSRSYTNEPHDVGKRLPPRGLCSWQLICKHELIRKETTP